MHLEPMAGFKPAIKPIKEPDYKSGGVDHCPTSA